MHGGLQGKKRKMNESPLKGEMKGGSKEKKKFDERGSSTKKEKMRAPYRGSKMEQITKIPEPLQRGQTGKKEKPREGLNT